jgi:lysine 2,3-aminomutase
VNDSAGALLDLCFALLDEAGITPYYFYMCDMIPGAEHWRLTVAEAQALQSAIMGYLPGFATPRVVCDVPYVGKRWVHQVARYDTERGVSYWTKSYLTALEGGDPLALDREYPCYDPVHLLPAAGQDWWRREARGGAGSAGLALPVTAAN